MIDEFEFTADWFSERIPIWREIIGRFPPKKILEVGSYEGRCACFLIQECESLNEIVCVDSWQGGLEQYKEAMTEVERRFDNNLRIACSRRATPVAVRKVKGSSAQALAYFIGSRESRFDLIYVDGSHEAPDVLTDAVNAFQLLSIGGILIFDDYTWRGDVSSGKDILNLPKLAIDAFVNTFHRKLIVFSAPLSQLYLRKTAE
jgi:predicted O-methyltransferase YrrM